MSLENLRVQIDEIDDKLVDLLNDRAKLSLEVGKQKTSANSTRFFAPERERDLIERLLKSHKGPLPKEALVAIYREIISASIALQKPITVTYFGPVGNFTEIASKQRFGSSATFYDSDTIADVFREVEKGNADFGVVPVENSVNGVVPYTLDMFNESSVKINAEVYLGIEQYLLSHAKAVTDIKRLYTFDQPLGQCRRWVDHYLHGVEIVEVVGTVHGALRAATDPQGAAIASKNASEVHNIPILAERIEDNPQNRTRFLVIGRTESPQTGRDKTSILVAVRNEPGSLGRALRSFEKHDVNLSMIASRPTKNVAREYVKFIDFQGHIQDEAVTTALKELREHSIYVTVLGSYPEG